MGFVKQFSTDRSLNSIPPCSQFGPFIKDIETNTYRLRIRTQNGGLCTEMWFYNQVHENLEFLLELGVLTGFFAEYQQQSHQLTVGTSFASLST